MNELVVFSHLRWNFVYQRPQQILSRLARKWRVLFVEEPVYSRRRPARGNVHAAERGVTVLTPHTPLTAPGFHDDQIPLLQKLVGQALAREGFDQLWRVALHADGACRCCRSFRRGSSSTIAWTN